jgi:hypothetical protein
LVPGLGDDSLYPCYPEGGFGDTMELWDGLVSGLSELTTPKVYSVVDSWG